MKQFVFFAVLLLVSCLTPATIAGLLGNGTDGNGLQDLDDLPRLPGLDRLFDDIGGFFDAASDFLNSLPFNQFPRIPEIVGDRRTIVGTKPEPVRAFAANPGGNVIQQFELSGCLNEHNRRRPADRPLSVDANLVKISLARSIEQANNREMTHDGREATYRRLGFTGSFGENLYSTYSSNKPTNVDYCQKALQGWVDNERADWEKYKNRSDMWNYFHLWGHYTQCQWKTTTKVGCAAAMVDNFYFSGSSTRWYAVFVTCTYQPPGNMNTGNNDEFRSNVLPLRTA